MFLELVTGNQSAAQRYVFFAERQVWKIPGIADDTPIIPVNKVGIIGAGTMGGGIAMNFANAGIPVTIVEMQQEALDRGLGVIRKNYENTAKRGRLTMDDVEKRMGLIKGSLELEDLADCDLIIEAVYRKHGRQEGHLPQARRHRETGRDPRDQHLRAQHRRDRKRDQAPRIRDRPALLLARECDAAAGSGARGQDIDAVIATSMQIAKKIGKIAALVGVCPGFVGNRILAQRQREAQKLMFEGAMPWDVDRVLYDFGFPMGPFAMSDLAGLDIGWVKEKSKGETIRDVLCEMDRRGQKTGAGYYDYDENRNAKPSPVTEKIIQDFVAKSGVNPRHDFRRGDPRAHDLSDDQRRRENSRRGQSHPRFRYRYRLDQRLWLARLSRRPDVLRRHDRPR